MRYVAFLIKSLIVVDFCPSFPVCRRFEQSWRHEHQKQVQEIELLKREGGDTALAAQWRQRYEKLSLEKVVVHLWLLLLVLFVFVMLMFYRHPPLVCLTPCHV